MCAISRSLREKPLQREVILFRIPLDIKLLFMTVKIFFQKEVSEGVDDNQKNALKDSEDKK